MLEDTVVYFNQRTGALHTVRWSKSTFCVLLSHKKYKIMQKNNKNCVLFCSVSVGKSCFSLRKSILTSERRVEHLFAGLNTQQETFVDPQNAK